MTIQEIEAKEKQLQAEMAAALTEAKTAKPATEAFDVTYGKYLAAKGNLAKIPAELAKAKAEANSGALKAVGATVGEAIGKLVEGLKVAELLGEPVKVVRYIVNDDGSVTVGFNPTTRLATKGAPRERKAANGHTQVVSPDGTKQSLTKFALAHASDEEKKACTYKTGVTPHVLIDTKPKFDAFCVAHNLSGFVYEVPSVEVTS
jgi:hypothetical protein